MRPNSGGCCLPVHHRPAAGVGDRESQFLRAADGDAARPIRKQFLASLATTFRDHEPETERYFATNILADYASDQPDLLADLLMDAEFKAYAAFFPIAQRQPAKTLPLFQAEIRKQATIPDSDKDSEMVKDRLAERQARAAITLLRMGKAGEIIPLLRHSADPRLRSFIVNWLKPLGAVPQVIADALEHIDPSIKPTPPHPRRQWMPSCSTPRPRSGAR